VRQEWETQPRGQIAAFAVALEELRNAWPTGPVQARLAEAAGRLNAEEPRAPSLGSLSCGGEDRAGNVTLGRTQITEWINPAAIAHTGTMKWNGFGSHRPRQVELIASAQLGENDPTKVGWFSLLDYGEVPSSIGTANAKRRRLRSSEDM
jgi:hypothetical protein